MTLALPERDAAIAFLRRGEADAIVVWKLDRLFRRVVDWQMFAGLRVIAVLDNIDTDHGNPAAQFVMKMLGVFVESEHEQRSARARAVWARRKAAA